MVVTPNSPSRKRGRPPSENGPLTDAEKSRRYQQRQRERRAYVERVTLAAEALVSVLQKANMENIDFPAHLVTGDVAATLEKIAVHVAHQISIERLNAAETKEVLQN